ncbi:ATP-grasp domain-containing protein [Flexithrix dorotheae]|uniref:ATP-grasp domain-containing protein n=1 Tax=Flexithrix dorotheae TaxID=70993 RepID=UPI00035F3D18|nr:ATP-grasp domain-containing protein [Flexithrix dorotheae]
MLNIKQPAFLIKIVNFEYWPYWVFYIPLYFYGFYLAFRSRSLTYFSATNPGMKYGGVMGESKISVLNKIQPAFLPKTIFLEKGKSINEYYSLIESINLSFPLIVKPNIGERGKGVEKINSKAELDTYFSSHNEDLLVQEYIDFHLELGILYYRYPGKPQGDISSVVVKGFLTIEGNGNSTLQELVENNTRAKGRKAYLQAKFEDKWKEIIPKGTQLLLEPIGNHCRGTVFKNGNHLINSQLVNVINEIACGIEGYYYGRFDLRVKSLEDLYKGENIKILELNGVSSEPAHIYDPSMKLWKAYKDVFKHAKIIWEIGRANHKKGVPYTSLNTFLKDLKIHFFPQPAELNPNSI